MITEKSNFLDSKYEFKENLIEILTLGKLMQSFTLRLGKCTNYVTLKFSL